MAVISNHEVYNYFLTNYAPGIGKNRHDSHRKSEVTNTYSKIVSSSKDAPLYKIKSGSDMTRFAIDLKEKARDTQNLVASLQSDSEDIESVFHKKIAISSNESAVSVEYMPESDKSGTNGFELGVERLARPQINRGNFLEPSGHSFEEGAHGFDLETNTNTYEFQYNVADGDTNLTVQKKIQRLINTSDVGLHANIVESSNGRQSALEIISKNTGLAEDENFLFDIHSDTSYNELMTLGIQTVSQPAANSVFTLNGTRHESLANNFTINNAFDITLNATTPEDTPAAIGFKTSTDAMADSIDDLVNAFNGFVELGKNYASSHRNSQLLSEMNGIFAGMGDDLASVGVIHNEDDTLALDREQISEAITSDEAKDAFAILNRFKNAISRQAEKTSLDPLNYVDKVPVEYKNPGHNFVAPYATSRYAGLLVDQVL